MKSRQAPAAAVRRKAISYNQRGRKPHQSAEPDPLLRYAQFEIVKLQRKATSVPAADAPKKNLPHRICIKQLGEARDHILSREIVVRSDLDLPRFVEGPPVPGVSRFLSQTVENYYKGNLPDYQKKWEQRKKQASSRGNYEDGRFFSEKPSISNCCICVNLKGPIQNFSEHLRSPAHQICLDSPILEISMRNIQTIMKNQMMLQFKDKPAVISGFINKNFPRQQLYLFFRYQKNNLLDLPQLGFFRDNAPDLQKYNRQMRYFSSMHSTTLTHQRGEQTIETQVPLCSTVNAFVKNQEVRKSYRDFEFSYQNFQELSYGNKKQKYLDRGYSKNQFAWDLIQELGRSKNYGTKILNSLNQLFPEESREESKEKQRKQAEKDISQFSNRISQPFSIHDLNLPETQFTYPKRRYGGMEPARGSQSIQSLTMRLEEIQQTRVEDQRIYLKNQRFNEQSIPSYEKWKDKIQKLIEKAVRNQDENVFVPRGGGRGRAAPKAKAKGKNKPRILKRDKKRVQKTS